MRKLSRILSCSLIMMLLLSGCRVKELSIETTGNATEESLGMEENRKATVPTKLPTDTPIPTTVPIAEPVNSYFFQGNITEVTYHGFFNPLNFRSFRQDVTLHIELLKEYEEGVLYTLMLEQLDLSDVPDVSEWDYITMGRRYLGYYYVTEDAIYMVPVQDIENGYTDECNQRIIEELEEDRAGFCEKYALVCCENGTEDNIDEQGYHCYVERDGDYRIYQYYNDDMSGTKFYQKIVWEKDKGIVYYNCGEGALKMHVEIWLDEYDVSEEPCSMGLDSFW